MIELSPEWKSVEDSLLHALSRHLEADSASDYESDRLHYGADLWPGVCRRKVWYRLKGAPRSADTLGDSIRFWGGRTLENFVGQALKKSGLVVGEQVLAKPLRPSAWAWAPGHADFLLVDGLLLEIKAPRAGLFHRAGRDRASLVKEGYRWQLSAYYHELKRRGVVFAAAWLFLDREGSNAPALVPLEGDLLIPLERIVEEEAQRAALVTLEEAPERIERSLVAEVLKGRGKGAKTKREVRAKSLRNWSCSYCPYEKSCGPGPEEFPAELTPDQQASVVAEAEKRWIENPKARVSIVVSGSADNLENEHEAVVSENETVEAQTSPDPVSAPTPSHDPKPTGAVVSLGTREDAAGEGSLPSPAATTPVTLAELVGAEPEEEDPARFDKPCTNCGYLTPEPSGICFPCRSTVTLPKPMSEQAW